jgi:hypothetical protein
MGINRRHIGAVLGILGGILGVLNMSVPLLNNPFWGYFTAYVVWGHVVMISCSTIVGGLLVFSRKSISGGYLMLIASIIWAISLPLMLLTSITWAIGQLEMGGTMDSVRLTLYPVVSPGILSLVGGALVLSARDRALESSEVRRRETHGEMEQSSEADLANQRAKSSRQTRILIRISALILLLPLSLITSVLLYAISVLSNALLLIFALPMIGILLYIAATT